MFVSDAIYPIDKTNLDVLRILHFLSLAVITVWFVPRDWPALKSPLFWPAILCRAAFAGNFLSRRVPVVCRPFRVHRSFERVLMQIVVSLIGIVIMVGVAALISWYRGAERKGPGPRPPTIKPGYAGATHEWVRVLLTLCHCWPLAGPAWADAQPAVECRMAAPLSSAISHLPHVNARNHGQASSTILVMGAGSSSLPGANGAKNAYPARLQQALSEKLPGVSVTVTDRREGQRTAARW